MRGNLRRGLSRREVLLAAPASTCVVLARDAPRDGVIRITAGPGAGPAPSGAPVETSVPFPAGNLTAPQGLVVLAPSGKPVLTETRAAVLWPDGSVRWLAVVFEPEEGPGSYALTQGNSPAAPPLLRHDGTEVRLNNGALSLRITESLTPLDLDLVLVRHDGKVFRSSLAGETRRMVIEDTGSVRASVRLEGACRATDGEGLFNYVLRLTVFRARPELHLGVTWINATPHRAEQLRDIRLVLPFDFAPERLVFGCDRGVYDGPFLKDWPVWLLQEDHDRYWARALNPDGRAQNLASGGAGGEHCPGWLSVMNRERGLAVYVPDFWQEYPNELSVRAGELSVGLWPERAAAHLASKPVLARDPFGGGAYSFSKYWPVMPHPYLAFFDPASKCLDVPQGVAKTQDLVIGIGNGDLFETKYWSGSLTPVRGHVDPSRTAAAESLVPRDKGRFPEFEQLYDESFGWLARHAEAHKAYGKFDYGDFRYFTASTDYLCHPGTKWGEMGEMPREGYWHNNERDVLRGVLFYYLRTADPAAWTLARRTARHLFDVDIRHHPHFGMWTHSYGHCYLALGEGGEPDHSWLAGMLLWAGLSGDPTALDTALRCADELLRRKMDFTRADARSGAVYLHAMCQFHNWTGQRKYRDAAGPPVEAFLKLQNGDGGWPAYMGDPDKPRMEGFVEHVVLALADYYAITSDERVRGAIDRALAHLFPKNSAWNVDRGESPLALHALALSGRTEHGRLARQVLEKLHAALTPSPDALSRGDLWAGWGVNEAGGVRVPGRPSQFLGQTRPLSPASMLAYGQQCLAALAATDQ